MKKLLNFNIVKAIFLGAFVLVALTGCDEEESFEPKLFLETESVVASNNTNEYSVDFVSNLPWEVSTDVDWIILEEESGDKGKHVINFTVLENNDEERTGSIMFKTSDNLVKSLEIKQITGNIYVKVGGTGEGTSWSDAANLDHAIEIAKVGFTIHIAAGTYVPGITVTGGDEADNRDKTFEVNKNIRLRGGYPADATSGTQADPEQFKTILSGEGASYHVVTVSAPKKEAQKVVLEGLTITQGNAGTTNTPVELNGVSFRRDYGGGIAIGNAIVDLINTDIVDNASEQNVAGLYAFGGSIVTVKNCKVNNNASGGNAGGAWIRESEAYVYDSEFNNNSGGTAAGFHAYPDANVYLYNTVIANNQGRSYGAAFYAREYSKGVLVNCLITGNTSTSSNGGGGVMMYNNCDVTIISSTISDNVINGPGGGVYRRLGTNVLHIYNSIISGNTQKDDGPDVDVYEADAEAPVIQASVTGSIVYDQNGGQMAGATFDVNTMLSAEYVPVGDNNPALENGMTSGELENLGSGFDPVIGADIISADMESNSRSGLTTMGALVDIQ